MYIHICPLHQVIENQIKYTVLRFRIYNVRRSMFFDESMLKYSYCIYYCIPCHATYKDMLLYFSV